MHLLLHHLRKDFRRLRLLLVAWLLLVGMQAVSLAVTLPAASGAGIGFPALSAVFLLAPVWQAALVIVAVPLLIHDDSPAGKNAFWLTRPIPARLVLVSKGLFLVLVFILIPLAVELAVFVGSKIGSADTLLAGSEIFLRRLALVSLVAGLAALTPDFLRFATWAGILVAVYAVFLGIFHVAGAPLEEGSALFRGAGASSLEASRSLLAGLAAIAIGLAVAGHQYLTRRTARSVVLACLGGVVFIGAGHFWKGDFFSAREGVAPQRSPGEAASTIVLDDGRVSVPGDDLPAGRYEAVATLPLEQGARYRERSESVVIRSIALGEAESTVNLLTRRVNLLLAPRYSPFGDEDSFYLLVNRRRGEAFRPSGRTASRPNWIPEARRLRRDGIALHFASRPPESPGGALGESPVLDRAWLAGAELVLARPERDTHPPR